MNAAAAQLWRSRWPWLIPFVLALATAAAYANSLAATFIFDDYALVVDDLRLRGLATALSASTRPLTRLTFHLHYWAAGAFKAADMRAVNILIHLAAGLRLYGVVRRTLRVPRLAATYGAAADGLAGAIAAVWLLHPLQTESVTYVMQRAESLMGMLFFLSLYSYARGLQSAVGHRWHTLAIVAAAFCMASKPVAVTLPVIVLLYGRAFAAGTLRESLRRRWSFHVGMAATWLVLLTILCKPNESTTSTGLGGGLPTPLQYFWTQQQVVLHYLRLALWPQGLCLDYAWPPVRHWTEALLPAMVLLPLFGLALWALVRNRPAGFAGMWFFINLAPTSSFLPVADGAFEHRMYLPLAGLIALAVCGAYRVLAVRSGTVALVALGLAVAATLGVQTARRNADYRTELTMWADVVSKRPENLRARNDLAVALSATGNADEAIAQYLQVLRRIPAAERRRLDAGEVVERGLVPADSYSYHYFRAHVNLGWLQFSVRHQPEAAAANLIAGLRVIPYHEQGRHMLKDVLRAQGVAENELDAELQRRLEAGGR